MHMFNLLYYPHGLHSCVSATLIEFLATANSSESHRTKTEDFYEETVMFTKRAASVLRCVGRQSDQGKMILAERG